MSFTRFSTRLLILNGLAILSAVVYHASIWAFMIMSRTPQGIDQMGAVTYYSLRAIEQAIIFGIPTFLFISGYFISFAIERLAAKVQWRVVLTRIKNLIIPYLFWSVLILVVDQFLGYQHSIQYFLYAIVAGKARIPYYYIPLLVQYLVLSPILVVLAKKKYKLLLIVTAFIQLATVSLRYDTFLGLNIPALQPILFIKSQGLFLSRIFFYTFGIVYGLHFSRSNAFKQNLLHYKWGLLAALVTSYALGVVEWEILQKFFNEISIGQQETLVDGFYALAFILCFLAFEEFAPPFSKQLVIMGGMSYGIYLVHWSVQEYISKLILYFVPWLISYQILMQPILIVGGLGIPILLMNLVNRSPIRQYYRYLFG